jgi:hypothetical protein
MVWLSARQTCCIFPADSRVTTFLKMTAGRYELGRYRMEEKTANKAAALAQLVDLRRRDRNDDFFALHEFDGGAWDFDYVVPWTKSACNLDAGLMIIGQDWASEDFLRDPKNNSPERVQLRKELGQDPHLATNKNIKRRLELFGTTWAQTYAKDVSVFIKPKKMTEKVPMSLLNLCAEKYAVPQLRIVRPVMATRFVWVSTLSIQFVSRWVKLPMRLRDALQPHGHTTDHGIEIYGVPYAGGLGLAAYRGRVGVDPIWHALAERYKRISVAP